MPITIFVIALIFMIIALGEIIYFWRNNKEQTISLLYKILGGTIIFSFLAFEDLFSPTMLSFMSIILAVVWGGLLSLIIALLLPAYIKNCKPLKIFVFILTVILVLLTISLFSKALDVIIPVIGCLVYYFIASYTENKIKIKFSYVCNILATISLFLFTADIIVLFSYFIRILIK